jgi:hypothetical protein
MGSRIVSKQAGVVLDYDQADLARDLEAFRQSGMP